jgi:hypothetical protein
MILLTFPHAAPSGEYDIGSTIIRPILEKALTDEGLEFESLVAEIPREVIDLNRPNDTTFTKKFFELLPKANVHLDIHSFPLVQGETEHGYNLREWGDSTVVMFAIPAVTEPQLLASMTEQFEEDGISNFTEAAGFENYLTNVASILFDTPSLLIEVNEEDDDSYSAVAAAVVAGLRSFLSVEPSVPASFGTPL